MQKTEERGSESGTERTDSPVSPAAVMFRGTGKAHRVGEEFEK